MVLTLTITTYEYLFLGGDDNARTLMGAAQGPDRSGTKGTELSFVWTELKKGSSGFVYTFKFGRPSICNAVAVSLSLLEANDSWSFAVDVSTDNLTWTRAANLLDYFISTRYHQANFKTRSARHIRITIISRNEAVLPKNSITITAKRIETTATEHFMPDSKGNLIPRKCR